MGGIYCSVITCKNSLSKTKNRPEGKRISYHHFPKDIEKKKIWVYRCGKHVTCVGSSGHVCSTHFAEDAYERDLRAELLNLKKRKILKKDALPTLNLPPDVIIEKPAIVTTINDNYDGLKSKLLLYIEENNKEKVINQVINISQDHDYIRPAKIQKLTENTTEIENISTENDVCTISNENISLGCSYYEKTRDEYEKTLLANEILLIRNNYLKDQLENLKQKAAKNNEKVEELKEILKEKQDKQLSQNKVQEILEKCFTKNQVKLILKRNRRAPWTTEEILQALTIRHFSKRCYIYLRKKLHFPLPGLSTLQRWLSNITVNQGLLPDVFRFMDIASDNFEDYERAVVLQFDKMKVKSCVEYNQLNNKNIGPHEQMLIVQARSLFTKWKQIVYVDFDVNMTQEILFKIIENLENINYNVLACVSNIETENIELWKKLNVTSDATWFSNPKTQENVFIFFNAPNLLELLQKKFLQTGFFWNDKKIDKKYLEILINKVKDLEINKEHLTKTNFKLAKELFSNTTSYALKNYFRKEINAIKTAEFFELINKWYDIFNSNSVAHIGTKSAFGTHLNKETKILNQFFDEILTLSCENDEIFQEMILISINSLVFLQKYIEKYNKTEIYTHKLNLNDLNILFEQLNKNCDEISPLNALNKIRVIVLGKKADFSKKYSNDFENEESIVSSVLNRIGLKSENETNITLPRKTGKKVQVNVQKSILERALLSSEEDD